MAFSLAAGLGPQTAGAASAACSSTVCALPAKPDQRTSVQIRRRVFLGSAQPVRGFGLSRTLPALAAPSRTRSNRADCASTDGGADRVDFLSSVEASATPALPPANPYYTEWQDGAAAVASECKRQPLSAEKLILTRGMWDWQVHTATRHKLVGHMRFENLHPRLDVYIPEVKAEVQLLAAEKTGRGVENCKVRVKVYPEHPDPDYPARPDGFWFAYILKHKKHTGVAVEVEIEAEEGTDLTHLQSAWVQVHYTVYGRDGVEVRTQYVVLPMSFVPPGPPQPLSQNWQRRTNAMVLPIPTHMLTHLDDPVRVVERYIMPLYQPGDIVAIAESPLAVMQGRYRHFREVKYSWLARLLCRLFDNASSLSTAVGMQSLIDVVGPLRVVFAAVAAIVLRVLFKRRGAFYELAGEQACLIDEVTGSIPPYDQCVVYGPENPVQAVREIRARTGVDAAVVDVNDLKRVKVLAATPAVRDAFLGDVLLDNPAGNANQQTPLVLIRPL